MAYLPGMEPVKNYCTQAANDFVVQLGALMHDIADAKFFDGDESVGANIAGDFLSSIRQDEYCEWKTTGRAKA